MLSLARLRRSRVARPLALLMALVTISLTFPARTARADDSGLTDGTNIAPAGAGFADGSAGLSASASNPTSPANATGDARTSYPFRLTTAQTARFNEIATSAFPKKSKAILPNRRGKDLYRLPVFL